MSGKGSTNIDDIIIGQDEILYHQEYIGEQIEGLNFNRIDLEDVRFVKCRMTGCDFSSCAIKGVTFDRCNLSNCSWKNSYFRDTVFFECKGDGSDFSQSSFIHASINGGSYHYGNFSATLWKLSEIKNSEFEDSFFSEAKFKNTVFDQLNLIRTDFFKAQLKGMDLSSCLIDGISVSDTFKELNGLRLNVEQAVVIARLLGVKFV